MNRDRLRAVLAEYESCKLERHEVQGIEHIGWGMNLETPWDDAWLGYLGVEDEDDIKVITQVQADWLFERAIDVAVGDARRQYAGVWEQLSALRREVLVNLLYNLGASRIRAFRRMNAALGRQDFDKAASELLDSKAARQTGDRYKKLADVLRYDDENFFLLSPVWRSDDVGGVGENRARAEMLETSGEGGSAAMPAALSGVSDDALVSEVSRRLKGQGGA